MLSSDKKQRLATGEEPLSLLCLGDDLLRYWMLDCIGAQELFNLCLCFKVFSAIGDLVKHKNGWLALAGTTVVCPRFEFIRFYFLEVESWIRLKQFCDTHLSQTSSLSNRPPSSVCTLYNASKLSKLLH